MNKTLITCIFLSVSILISDKANAQLGISAPTASFEVKIAEILDLAITSGATNTFEFNTIAQIDAGIEVQNAVTLTYKSNKPWFVNINANSPNFTGSSATPMPCSVLMFKLNGSGSYTPLSTTPSSLSGTSALKNPRGAASIGVDYKISPGYTYDPANDYGLVISYSISNQ